MSSWCFSAGSLSRGHSWWSSSDSLERPREGVSCSVLDLRNDLVLVVVGELTTSARKGGIFSLLPSPSTIVLEYLARFGVGDWSGVGGNRTSQGEGVADDASDDVDSEGAWRFPRTELRVCMMSGGRRQRRGDGQGRRGGIGARCRRRRSQGQGDEKTMAGN